MLNKKDLLKKIDDFIAGPDNNLSAEQINRLEEIKSKIDKSASFADICKWLFELIKLMGAFKALLFDS